MCWSEMCERPWAVLIIWSQAGNHLTGVWCVSPSYTVTMSHRVSSRVGNLLTPLTLCSHVTPPRTPALMMSVLSDATGPGQLILPAPTTGHWLSLLQAATLRANQHHWYPYRAVLLSHYMQLASDNIDPVLKQSNTFQLKILNANLNYNLFDFDTATH